MTLHSDPHLNADAATPVEHPNFYRTHAKRVLDVCLVVFSAPVVVPLIALLALAIMLGGGTPFYSQTRLGRGGKAFKIWKLRSMMVDADKALKDHLAANAEARSEWNETQKLQDDPRITRIGRLIRRTSLDELPQLWNVLRGDMSLVGPRPMMPGQRHLYPGRAYFSLRPGITGNWQISDRNRSSFAARAEFDQIYDRSLSILTDLAIIAATFAVVLRATGR